MNKIAKSVSEGIELVEAMFKGGAYFNGEWYEENGNSAYLDWGAINDMYTNISCKYFADEVGREFQRRGYFVYYQVCGYGTKLSQGTPIAIRIQSHPKDYNSSMVCFY